MAKRNENTQPLGYQRANARAKHDPSSIVVAKNTVLEIKSLLGKREFEIQKEIYVLLQEAETSEKQIKILQDYLAALEDIEDQAKISISTVWSAKLPESGHITEVLIDPFHQQVIIATSDDELSKKGAIYAFDLKTGKKNWSYIFSRKNTAPWQILLDKEHLFFVPQYTGESDSLSFSHLPHALSLSDGSFLWKYMPQKDGDGEATKLLGIYRDMLIFQTHEGSVAVDIRSGREKWKVEGFVRISKDLFLPCDDEIILQNGEHTIGWYTADGQLVRELKLKFPKKDKGLIYSVYAPENENKFYVCLWDSEHDYRKTGSPKLWEYCVVYEVDKKTRRAKELANLSAICPLRILQSSSGKGFYLSGEKESVVFEKKSNSKMLARRLSYPIKAINDGLLFCPDEFGKMYSDSCEFFVRDSNTEKVKWHRTNFNFLTHSRDLIFGVEMVKTGHVARERFVVLNQKTGMEVAGFYLDGLHSRVVVDGRRLIVVQEKRIDLLEMGTANLS